MMNYVFPFLILISVVFSILTGSSTATATSLLESGTDAVELSITLLGAMCLWGGLMNIARASGLTDVISRLLSPIICRLMPSLKENHTAKSYVSMNIVSNFLGLGNAATPLGLMAMHEMNRGRKSDTATNDMITFVVLNTASIQLIPSTLAVMRSQAGSSAPLEIMPCIWLSSTASVIIALIICRLFRNEKGMI